MQKLCKFPGCDFPFDPKESDSRLFCPKHVTAAIMVGLQREYKNNLPGPGKEYLKKYRLKNRVRLKKDFGYKYNKVYADEYKKNHAEAIRQYMKAYMKRYRAKGRDTSTRRNLRGRTLRQCLKGVSV